MDAKASAKSKRAHSLQAKRAHSSHSPKNPTPSPVGNPKIPQKQNRDKTRQSQPLPSNWDRYYEDEGLGSDDLENSSVSATGPAHDVVAPKSKGADFTELISQAQTEARTRSNPNLDCFASFNDDLFPDFDPGISSMLSVKGNSILSRCQDDSFIVDDSATSSYEASFLSMDLHALAAQLEKIDISQRLFIERDLLPEELCAHGSKENSPGSETGETSHVTGMENNPGNNSEVVPSTSISLEGSQALDGHHYTTERAGERRSLPIFAWQNAKPDPVTVPKQFHQNNVGEVFESISQVNAAADLKEKKTLRSEAAAAEAGLDMLLSTINETKETKTSRFEAAAAQAELDMLLDSFGETKLLDPVDIGREPSQGFPSARYESQTTFLKESSAIFSTQPIGLVPDSHKHASMIDARDNAIDELLAEMPILSNQDHAACCPLERAGPKDLPSSSGSKALDDFDSWLDTL